jgi:hypothetical protein
MYWKNKPLEGSSKLFVITNIWEYSVSNGGFVIAVCITDVVTPPWKSLEYAQK